MYFMDYATLLVLAAGLSVDSFAVSLGCGFSKQGICIKRTLGLALSLALFQALAPVLGWMMGTGVKNYVAQVDHWIAFGLLAIIGGKMILESTKKGRVCLQPVVKRDIVDVNRYQYRCVSGWV